MEHKSISRKYICVNTAICVACGACVKACPRAALSIWKGCYAQVDGVRCVGCGKCARACPAGCIEVRERETV